jgi:DNA-binding transcriptional regulator YhcF (GntR family)
MFVDITIQKDSPICRQIEKKIRAAIASGELPPGSRLPSVHVLAKQLKTSSCTVQIALKSLALDGLLKRTPRVGTFVTPRAQWLTSVGLYFGRDFFHGQGMAFYRALHQQLMDDLNHRGVRHKLHLDSRPKNKQGEPLPELAAAVARGEIQGLILGICDSVEMAWLRKLGVPMALSGSWNAPYGVAQDIKQMMSFAMQDFRHRGCRSVSVILPIPPAAPGDQSLSHRVLFQSFVDAAADAGLETRNSWVRVPEQLIPVEEHEDFGYREFQHIWKQTVRPDALFVFPDTVVRGTVTGILQAGISVPGELKLVFHRNSGIPVFCPMPASWVELDIAKAAASLIHHIECQLAGQTITEPSPLPFTLVECDPLSLTNNKTYKNNPKSLI